MEGRKESAELAGASMPALVLQTSTFAEPADGAQHVRAALLKYRIQNGTFERLRHLWRASSRMGGEGLERNKISLTFKQRERARQ